MQYLSNSIIPLIIKQCKYEIQVKSCLMKNNYNLGRYIG